MHKWQTIYNACMCLKSAFIKNPLTNYTHTVTLGIKNVHVTKSTVHICVYIAKSGMSRKMTFELSLPEVLHPKNYSLKSILKQ